MNPGTAKVTIDLAEIVLVFIMAGCFLCLLSLALSVRNIYEKLCEFNGKWPTIEYLEKIVQRSKDKP